MCVVTISLYCFILNVGILVLDTLHRSSPLHSPYRSSSSYYAPYRSSSLSSLQRRSSICTCTPPFPRGRASASWTRFPSLPPLSVQHCRTYRASSAMLEARRRFRSRARRYRSSSNAGQSCVSHISISSVVKCQ